MLSLQRELGVKNVNWQEADENITFDGSRNDLSILRSQSIGSRSLEDTSTINASKREEETNVSVFKVPLGGPIKKALKRAPENSKTSPTKVERLLKSMEIEPVKMGKVPEIVIGEKFSHIPGPSKTTAEERLTSVPARTDVSTGTSSSETDVPISNPSTGSNVSATCTTKGKEASTVGTYTVVSARSTREMDVSTRTGRMDVSTGRVSSETSVSTEITRMDVSNESASSGKGVSTIKKTDALTRTAQGANTSSRSTTREVDVSTKTDFSTKTSTRDEESSVSSCRTSFSVCETSTNSDMFDQNICDIDAAMHSSMNSPVKETSKDAGVSRTKSSDVFFESFSLSESAFKDMSAMRQPDNTNQDPAVSGDSGMDVCFSLSTMSESAFTKKVDVELSQDLFNSQTEISMVKKVKRNSEQLHTPSPPWQLRSRRGSSSGPRKRRRSSSEDMFASPNLDSPTEKSPSLFGESFEIDSQLRKALDCSGPTESRDRSKRKISGDSPVNVITSVCSDSSARKTRSASRRFFGSAKKDLTPSDLSTSAIGTRILFLSLLR